MSDADGGARAASGHHEDDRVRSAAHHHGETEAQVLDRNLVEILQELRVTQAGVQILFAFLLSIAFSNRFADASRFERDVYLVTLLLCTMSTGLLIAPVAYHRLLFRKRQRRELVAVANRLSIAGLFLLLLAMVGAVLLIMHFVLGNTAVTWVASAWVLGWLAVLWVAAPLRQRLRAERLARGG